MDARVENAMKTTGMKKVIDIRLNVQPIFLALYHEHVFEGPCRFGKGDELKKEYDLALDAMIYDRTAANWKTMFDEKDVNVLEPIILYRDETFLTTDWMLEEIAKTAEQTDIYLFATASRPYDLIVEFAQRIKKPICMMQDCCGSSIVIPACRARGVECWGFTDMEDANLTFKALRVRKALSELKVLALVRNNSNVSISAPDSFVSLEDVTMRFGARFRFLNIHELLDYTHVIPQTENHTTPGRHDGLNLTEDEMKEAEAMADEFIAKAEECHMERDMVAETFRAYRTILKVMNAFECNAFTAPCPDVCATRRINEEKFTFCLTHSLLNEQGVPSACEYDVPALFGAMLLQNVSRCPSYQGNTITAPLVNGMRSFVPRGALLNRESVEKADKELGELENVCLTFHAVPTRFPRGFESAMEPYSIRSFAHSGFGATVRYDFKRDIGESITMARFDPTGTKLFVAKGKICGGVGYGDRNCSEGVFFQVENSSDFFQKQLWFGNHVPLVYGDWMKEMVRVGEILGLEVITA
ncbi:MAG: fucose isomerase [Eubacterium sp.]|nr:fucose isomerase [Eubacterium sp.]